METTKLEKTGACKEAIFYVRTQKNYEEAWNNCPRGDWMLWIADKLQINKRLLTLAKGKCAATVLHLMQDERSKDAVQAAIDYGNGLISDEELKNAVAAARAAYHAAYVAYAYAADAVAVADAYAASAAAAAATVTDADAYAASAVADAAAGAAAANAYAASAVADAAAANATAYAADTNAAREKNLQETADICRDLLTDEVFNKWNNFK